MGSKEVQPLTNDETQDLESLEYTIGQGQTAFLEVGRALLEIRDRRLYRGPYDTFEEYLAQRWKYSRARGYQLLEAAKVVEKMSTVVDTPESERHVRALLVFAPHLRDEIWRTARETAPQGKLTAEWITRVGNEIRLRELGHASWGQATEEEPDDKEDDSTEEKPDAGGQDDADVIRRAANRTDTGLKTHPIFRAIRNLQKIVRALNLVDSKETDKRKVTRLAAQLGEELLRLGEQVRRS